MPLPPEATYSTVEEAKEALENGQQGIIMPLQGSGRNSYLEVE